MQAPRPADGAYQAEPPPGGARPCRRRGVARTRRAAIRACAALLLAGALLGACGGPNTEPEPRRAPPTTPLSRQPVTLLGAPPSESAQAESGPGEQDTAGAATSTVLGSAGSAPATAPGATTADGPGPGPGPDRPAGDDLGAEGAVAPSGDDTPADAAGGEPAAEDVTFAAAFPGRRALVHATVREYDGRPRSGEALCFGVPLARGTARDAAALRLWDARNGEGLPAQTRALSRWPDGSLRWVLVDTHLDVEPTGVRRLAVGPADDLPALDDPWTLTPADDGGLTASDGRRTWNVWAPAADGDRVLDLRALLVGRFGNDYVARVDPQTVEVLERGPLRLVLAVRGSHHALSGEPGLPDPFHTFTARLHLLAGAGLARIEWSLENGPLHDPPGRLGFVSYGLETPAPAAVQGVDLPVRRADGPQPFRVEHIDGGRRLVLDGDRLPTGPRTTDGWCGLRGREHDLWVHREDAAGNHPNALRWRPGEPLNVDLLRPHDAVMPDEWFEAGEVFHLDDATRKTFRLTLGRDLGARGPAIMHAAAGPLHVSLSPLEVLLTRAWGDAGLIYPPSPGEGSKPVGPPRDPPSGWADYGEALTKNTHSSGSPRNKLSVFLEAVQTGHPEPFRWARTRARHAMDLRPYHILGFDADEYPAANLYEGTPHPNIKASLALGRREMDTRWPEWGKGLPGHGYNGFDPEHMTLDDVYECYLLTGSWPAREALRSAGEAMLTWMELVPGGYIHSSRTFGWTLRALVQVHRATGEARYLDAARRYVERADAERGHGEVKWLRRMKPDPRHMAEPHDTPFMVAVALHGLAAYWHETADPRVPPMCADLTAFLMSAYRGQGFLDDLPTDRPAPRGGNAGVRAMGVSSWIPGAIAAAAFVTGDHEPVDRLSTYYEHMLRHQDQPIVLGGKDWHWWQPYLVSLLTRHGSVRVPDPPGGR